MEWAGRSQSSVRREITKRIGGGSNGALGRFQSPWGAAVISMQNAANIAGFGPYYPDVLIGNYGSGEIDAYNFTSGKYDGTLGTYASEGFEARSARSPRPPDDPLGPRHNAFRGESAETATRSALHRGSSHWGY